MFTIGLRLVLVGGLFAAVLWPLRPDAAEPADGNQAKVSQPLPDRVTFNAHIRPIMSGTCFTCHGPDEEENESEFRIDSFASATGPLPSDDELVGIVPGEPMQSEVYLRIIDQGAGESMPPEHFRHQLSEHEKALFRRWIEQGAEYEQHWSYAPIQRPVVPEVQGLSEHVATPVDAFVMSKLQSAAIAPSPAADKATLLRRLSLDLIGLPPTPQQLQAFLENDSPDAYHDEVERLLASKHYGEHMARGWLDLVRFADTVGFHGDQNMHTFAYRDYVISSFNANKPFDQFTREQIAGDLLDNPTPEQLTATGVLRLNMVTREGGAQPGEYLAKYKADRVRMLGTAWLGSTLACCECHNHKYDPFSIKDFYSLGAFFDDLRQWGVYSDYGYTPNPDLRGFNNDYPFPPELRVASDAMRAEIQVLQAERDQRFADAGNVDTGAVQAWAENIAQFTQKHPEGWMGLTVDQAETTHDTRAEILTDQSVRLTGKGHAEERIDVRLAVPTETMVSAIRLEVLSDDANGGFVGRSDDGRFSLGLDARWSAEGQVEAGEQPNRPRYVRIELRGANKVLSLAEVEVYSRDEAGELQNIARQGTATHSSNYTSGEAALAIDGNTDGQYHRSKSVTHTSLNGSDPWWEVDLGAEQALDHVVVYNRTDGNYQDRLNGFRLVLLDAQRRRLFTATPETPKPQVRQDIPETVRVDPSVSLEIAWAEADRYTPQRYRNGQPPLELGDRWHSGPGRWQLPADEARRPHTAVYHLAQPLAVKPTDRLTIRLTSQDVGRVRFSVTPLGHAIAGWPAVREALATALQTPAAERTTPMQDVLAAEHHLATTPFANQHLTIRAYRNRILALHSGYAMTLVAQPIPEDAIPTSRVRRRGDWMDEGGELAPPAFPHFLPGASDHNERRLNRIDLANWLTSRENPLTARHLANRTWRQFFAHGLSAQLDDLGSQGEWPSHPQLLDWLAAELIDSGWDLKHLMRLIVNSHTYRQAAAVRDDLTDIDPYNRLLAQQSPRRLAAEAVRDNALSIAGLLDTRYVGGPSIYPYQPAGHYGNLQFPNRQYQASEDFRQYRRGVYMHWQRTFLHPMLVNFDAPSRDECVAERTPSNSPQQALTLLNDPSFVEAARAMAERILRRNPKAGFDQRLDDAFVLALARRPRDEERGGLQTLFDDQRSYFAAHPEEAKKQISVGLEASRGESAWADDLPAAEADAHLAAWTQVCRVLLNLHETITRY